MAGNSVGKQANFLPWVFDFFLAFDGKGTLMRVSQCAIRLIITLDVFAHYFSSMENYL